MTQISRKSRSRFTDYIIPACAALACAGAAYAGADTTFDPALTKFTDFLEGSGGKIITVLSLAGGLIGLASGRFSLGQVAVPVGVTARNGGSVIGFTVSGPSRSLKARKRKRSCR